MEVIAYGHSFLHPAADWLGIARSCRSLSHCCCRWTGGVQAGEAFAKAFYGPLKFTLVVVDVEGQQSKAKSKPTRNAEKPDTSPPPTVIKTVEGEKASMTIKVEPDKSALPAPHRGPQRQLRKRGQNHTSVRARGNAPRTEQQGRSAVRHF